MYIWPEISSQWAVYDFSCTECPGEEASEAESEEEASSDQSEQQEPENIQEEGPLMSIFLQSFSHCSVLTHTSLAAWCFPWHSLHESQDIRCHRLNQSLADGPGDSIPSHRLEDLSEEDFDDTGAASEDSDVQRMREKLAEQKRYCV